MKESEALTEKIVKILEDKKAKEIQVIDIRSISILADFFIICTGNSTTNVKAIADELEDKIGKGEAHYFNKEGYDSARWILVDFGEVVVHIFHHEDRNFYNIERIWSDGITTYFSNDDI